jgi:hypothetical protein
MKASFCKLGFKGIEPLLGDMSFLQKTHLEGFIIKPLQVLPSPGCDVLNDHAQRPRSGFVFGDGQHVASDGHSHGTCILSTQEFAHRLDGKLLQSSCGHKSFDPVESVQNVRLCSPSTLLKQAQDKLPLASFC